MGELPSLCWGAAGMAMVWREGGELWPTVAVACFTVHYIQRTLVYPFLIRGDNPMPHWIVAAGALFNCLNGFQLVRGTMLAPGENLLPTGDALRPLGPLV